MNTAIIVVTPKPLVVIDETHQNYNGINNLMFLDILCNFVRDNKITIDREVPENEQWSLAKTDHKMLESLEKAVEVYIAESKRKEYQRLKNLNHSHVKNYNHTVMVANYGEEKAELYEYYNRGAVDEQRAEAEEIREAAKKRVSIYNLIQDDHHALQIVNSISKSSIQLRNYLKDHEYFLGESYLAETLGEASSEMNEIKTAFETFDKMRILFQKKLETIRLQIYNYARKYVKYRSHNTEYQLMSIFRSESSNERRKVELQNLAEKFKTQAIANIQWLANIMSFVPETRVLFNDWICQTLMIGYYHDFDGHVLTKYCNFYYQYEDPDRVPSTLEYYFGYRHGYSATQIAMIANRVKTNYQRLQFRKMIADLYESQVQIDIPDMVEYVFGSQLSESQPLAKSFAQLYLKKLAQGQQMHIRRDIEYVNAQEFITTSTSPLVTVDTSIEEAKDGVSNN